MQCHRLPRARPGHANPCCRPDAESRGEAMAGHAAGQPPRRAGAAGAPDRHGCCCQADFVRSIGLRRHLGMHRRTLNRQLAAEGESVTTIINAVRAELAEEYLANSKRKLYEVAELLGFSSAADFSRWFRGQFGKTPSDWAAHYRESKAAAGARLAQVGNARSRAPGASPRHLGQAHCPERVQHVPDVTIRA